MLLLERYHHNCQTIKALPVVEGVAGAIDRLRPRDHDQQEDEETKENGRHIEMPPEINVKMNII